MSPQWSSKDESNGGKNSSLAPTGAYWGAVGSETVAWVQTNHRWVARVCIAPIEAGLGGTDSNFTDMRRPSSLSVTGNPGLHDEQRPAQPQDRQLLGGGAAAGAPGV